MSTFKAVDAKTGNVIRHETVTTDDANMLAFLFAEMYGSSVIVTVERGVK